MPHSREFKLGLPESACTLGAIIRYRVGNYAVYFCGVLTVIELGDEEEFGWMLNTWY